MLQLFIIAAAGKCACDTGDGLVIAVMSISLVIYLFELVRKSDTVLLLGLVNNVILLPSSQSHGTRLLKALSKMHPYNFQNSFHRNLVLLQWTFLKRT